MLSRYNCTVPWVPEVPGAKICTEKKVIKVANYDLTFFADAVTIFAVVAAAAELLLLLLLLLLMLLLLSLLL